MTLETIIDGLSRDEQLIAMEMLWTRISQGADAATPPGWHREVVADRIARLRDGSATLSDWSDAKKRLSERLQ